MGIIRTQSIKNSIFSYIGVLLGYINLILLFPNYFTTEQFGLIQLLIIIAEVYSLLSAGGLTTSVIRFFPFYKSVDKQHEGFLIYVFLITFSGFTIISILYLIFRPLIVSAYIQKSSMFIDYYFILIPFAFLSLVFNIFEVLVRAVLRTSFSVFVREVVLRILTTIGIFLYIYGIINFHEFIIYYISIFLVCALLILFQIILSREYSLNVSFKNLHFFKLVEITKYGFYTLISGAAMQTGLRIPALLIGSMVGLSMVGIYNLYYHLASVIYIPLRAMSRIAVPIIATAWKENNLNQIRDIYVRTSIIQLIFGLLIYVGVIINRNNLFHFVKNSDYNVNFVFFPIIGLGILIDVATGLNSDIILNSPKYKYDSFFNVLLLIICISAGLVLIPVFGGIGAALGFVLAYLSFNFLKWLFLFRKYQMQPFSYKQIVIIICGAVIYLIGDNIPVIDNILLDIFIRSTIVTVIYFFLMLLLKISPDFNERFKFYKNRLLHK
ncbi:MAG: polysaccharide biosynthesis C-terminal domain-containing protein [Ignavibacteria bacterium]